MRHFYNCILRLLNDKGLTVTGDLPSAYDAIDASKVFSILKYKLDVDRKWRPQETKDGHIYLFDWEFITCGVPQVSILDFSYYSSSRLFTFSKNLFRSRTTQIDIGNINFENGVTKIGISQNMV